MGVIFARRPGAAHRDGECYVRENLQKAMVFEGRMLGDIVIPMFCALPLAPNAAPDGKH